MINNKLNNYNELLERIAADDRNAYTELYTDLYPKLFRYVLVMTRSETISEEVLQEVFIKLWIKRHTLVGIRSLADFVFRMTRNQLIDYQRKMGRIVNVPEDTTSEKPSHTNIFYDLLLKEYLRIAQKAIAALPQRKREIFLLNAQEELTAREIADKLQLSLPTVKKQLFEANHFIRDYLSKHGELMLLIFYFHFIFS